MLAWGLAKVVDAIFKRQAARGCCETQLADWTVVYMPGTVRQIASGLEK